MNKKDVDDQPRSRIAKELGRNSIPNPVWNNLLKRGLVQDFLNDEYEFEELVRDAEIQLETYLETREEARKQRTGDDLRYEMSEGSSEVAVPELHAYEEARANALSEYIALHASMDGQVRHFRRVVLEGELLARQQAYDFVSSPANRCFPIAWFLERRIPMRSHYSLNRGEERGLHDQLHEDEKGNRYRFDDIYVEPPGESFRKFTCEPLDPNRRDSLSFPFTNDPYRGVEEYPVEVGSVLDVLRRISSRLVTDSGLAWEEAQTAWFVLTGEASPVMILQGQLSSFWVNTMRRATITVTAEPWVPADSVRRHYREMQKAVLGGKDNHPLSDKGLALFRFVVGQFKAAVPDVEKLDAEARTSPQVEGWEVDARSPYVFKGPRQGERGEVTVAPFVHELAHRELAVRRPSWRALQERWNRSCKKPEWRYSDVRNFHRAFFRVARAMLTTAQEDEEMLRLFGAKDVLP